MAKAKFYQTSVTHHTNTDIIRIRMKHGWNGYGLYHALMQVLANTEDRVMSLSEVPQIAFSLQVDEQLLMEIITSYMTVDNEVFYSEDLDESLKRYDGIVSAGSAGGKATAKLMTIEERIQRGKNGATKRWAKHKTVTDSTQTVPEEKIPEEIVPENTVPEKKIPEKKIPEKIVIDSIILDGNQMVAPDSKDIVSKVSSLVSNPSLTLNDLKDFNPDDLPF